MTFEDISPLNRAEAELAMQAADPAVIVGTLLSIAFHDPDWRWVQRKCLDSLQSPCEKIRATAVTCLGHLARIHGSLDLDIVLPALQVVGCEPGLTSKVEDAIDDISMFVKHG